MKKRELLKKMDELLNEKGMSKIETLGGKIGEKDMYVSECIKDMTKTGSYRVKDGRKRYLCNFYECLKYFGNREIAKISYEEFSDGSNPKELPIITLKKQEKAKSQNSQKKIEKHNDLECIKYLEAILKFCNEIS